MATIFNLRHSTMVCRALMVITMALGGASCSADNGAATAGDGSTGRVRVHMHDFPLGDRDITQVVVTVREVQIGSDADGWRVLDDTPREHDLLTLVDGVSVVLADTDLPAGTYQGLRLILSRDNYLIADGQRLPLSVPSGEQTGIKLIGPFTIDAGRITDITLDFNAERSVRWNRGRGYWLKPTISIVSVTSDGEVDRARYDDLADMIEAGGPATEGVVADKLMVRFRPGTAEDTISALNERIGAVVIGGIPALSEVHVGLPDGVSLAAAIRHYAAPEVESVGLVLRLEPEAPNEGTERWHRDINAQDLWDRLDDMDGAADNSIGSRETLVAVIDGGFDLDHPDMMPNWALNLGEIPAALNITDTDDDGRITFIDLNDPANIGQCQAANNLPNVCDPLDLLGDPAWANGVDDDGDGRVDDLVGFDFDDGDGNADDQNGSHGTGTASIIGAVGDNAANGDNVFGAPAGGIAGLNWRGRIMPLRVGRDTQHARAAIDYAVTAEVDIINISMGAFNLVGPRPANCSRSGITDNLPAAQVQLLDTNQRAFWANTNLGESLVIFSAGNCAIDVPNAVVHVVLKSPLQQRFPNQVLIVASADTTNQPIALAATSARGDGYADIAAPGVDIEMLDVGGATRIASGTSFAAPIVSGTAALLLQLNPHLRGQPEALRTAVLRAYDPNIDLADITEAPGTTIGRYLDLSETECPAGQSGAYCGDAEVGQGAASVYWCSDGAYDEVVTCANGCVSEDQGTPDHCGDAACPGGQDGLYCDVADDALYRCAGGSFIAREAVCNEGCVPSDGGDDMCAPDGGECATSFDCPLETPLDHLQSFGALRGGVRHLALDLGGAEFDMVRSVCAGPVVYTGDHRGYASARDYEARGPVVIQQCEVDDTPVIVLYGHCTVIAPVEPVVEPGDPICRLSFYEGPAGEDWSHLHWGTRPGDFFDMDLADALRGQAADGPGWEHGWVDPETWSP